MLTKNRMKVLIMGAAGAGTTTLAGALAKVLDGRHLDADDYYWEPTDPPYQRKRDKASRNQALQADFLAQAPTIVSGSLFSWGPFWPTAFDLIVFLYLPPTLRMQRLRAREYDRYGDALTQDPILRQQSRDFLAWAEQYDSPTFTGRSYRLHQEWLSEVDCPVLRLTGDLTVAERVERVVQYLG